MSDRAAPASGHNFRRMLIYDRAIQLAAQVYTLTRKLPSDEAFGLTTQLRRAALSVVLNIAEGSGVSSGREFVRFLEIARRSIYEVEAGLEVGVRLALLVDDDCRDVIVHTDQLAAMITGFRSRLCRRKDER